MDETVERPQVDLLPESERIPGNDELVVRANMYSLPYTMPTISQVLQNPIRIGIDYEENYEMARNLASVKHKAMGMPGPLTQREIDTTFVELLYCVNRNKVDNERKPWFYQHGDAFLLAYEGVVTRDELDDMGLIEERPGALDNVSQPSHSWVYDQKNIKVVYVADFHRRPGQEIDAGKCLKEFLDDYAKILKSEDNPPCILMDARIGTSERIVKKHFDKLAQGSGRKIKLIGMETTEREGIKSQALLVVPDRKTNPESAFVYRDEADELRQKKFIESEGDLTVRTQYEKMVTDLKDVPIPGGFIRWHAGFPTRDMESRMQGFTQSPEGDEEKLANLKLLIKHFGDRDTHLVEFPFSRKEVVTLLGGDESIYFKFFDGACRKSVNMVYKGEFGEDGEFLTEGAMEQVLRKNYPGLFIADRIPEVQSVDYQFDVADKMLGIKIVSPEGLVFVYKIKVPPVEERNSYKEFNFTLKEFWLTGENGISVDLMPQPGTGVDEININRWEPSFISDLAVNTQELSRRFAITQEEAGVVRATFTQERTSYSRVSREKQDARVIYFSLVYDLPGLVIFEHEKGHATDTEQQGETFSELWRNNEPGQQVKVVPGTLADRMKSWARELNIPGVNTDYVALSVEQIFQERRADANTLLRFRDIFRRLGLQIHEDGSKFSSNFKRVADAYLLALFSYQVGVNSRLGYHPATKKLTASRKIVTQIEKYRRMYDALDVLRKGLA